MISIKIDTSAMKALQSRLAGQQKQVRFATAVALTRTAKHAQASVIDEMRAKFDRPTPTTLRSLFVKPATKANLEAMVYLKTKPLGGKNPRSMAQTIGHQFGGGPRNAKMLEEALRASGYVQAGEFIVPAAGAKLDRYGNWQRGQIVQALSQLRIGRGGYDNASTGSQRSQRNVAKAGAMFWSLGKAGKSGAKQLIDKATGIAYGYVGRVGQASHLAKGIWMRTSAGLKPIAIVVSGAPRYRKVIDMERIARQSIAQHFDQEFDRAFAAAMSTAR